MLSNPVLVILLLFIKCVYCQSTLVYKSPKSFSKLSAVPVLSYSLTHELALSERVPCLRRTLPNRVVVGSEMKGSTFVCACVRKRRPTRKLCSISSLITVLNDFSKAPVLLLCEQDGSGRGWWKIREKEGRMDERPGNKNNLVGESLCGRDSFSSSLLFCVNGIHTYRLK